MFKVTLVICFLALWSLAIATGCPDEAIIRPCSCASSFKRRSAVGNAVQNQYHMFCQNVTYSELKNIFKNISDIQGTDEVFDHFSGSDLFKANGFIADDFFAGLKIKSVAITHSHLISFGPKAFRDVTDSLDLSYNDIELLPPQLNLMVKKVNLSRNKLAEVKANTFASQTIDLSHNSIALVRESAFKVSDVLNVNLDGNQLQSNSFEKGFIRTFSRNTENLSINLHLNYNQLTHLEREVFEPLLQSPQTTITLANNPLKCDCRVKWVLEAKRYDSSWSIVYPRIDSAICADGSDLLKEFYSKDISNCADDILREDVDILSPCKLNERQNLRCYRSNYEAVGDAISPLNSLFAQPVALKSLTLERVSFPEVGEAKSLVATLEKDVFEYFKIGSLKIINTNLKKINPSTFSASARSLEDINLSSNQLVDSESDEDSVFTFLSKFISLKNIDLSNNQLSVVPSSSLSRMSSLQSINLQNNGLKLIQKHAFAINPSGSSLYRSLNIDLQSNQLTEKSFEPNFLSNLRDNVKVILNLERNAIKTVDDDKNFLRDIFDLDPIEMSPPAASETNPIVPNSSKVQIVTPSSISFDSILDIFRDDDDRRHRLMSHHSVILNDNPLVCSSAIRSIMKKHLIQIEQCDDYSALVNRQSAAKL